MFTKATEMLQRRLMKSKDMVRCPNCLPSTLEWYRGLAKVMQRVLENVPQIQDPNRPQYETQQSMIRMMQRAEPQLVKAAEEVIFRSSNSSSGSCGWCGEYWAQMDRASQVAGTQDRNFGPLLWVKHYGVWLVAAAAAVVAVCCTVISPLFYKKTP
jgi:hypothetical protein